MSTPILQKGNGDNSLLDRAINEVLKLGWLSEDQQQEAALRVIKYLTSATTSLNDPDSVPQWVRAIARNVRILERQKTVKYKCQALITDVVRRDEKTPYQQCELKEKIEQLRKDMAKLPVDANITLTLIAEEDLSYEQAARIMSTIFGGYSVKKISNIVWAAREALKKK